MASKSTSFVLVGLGFNGFGQMDGSGSDGSPKPAKEMIVNSPKELLVSSQSSFHVSIAWDSMHICTEEEDTKSSTGGRWTKTIEKVQSKLGQRVTKIDVDTTKGMVLQTAKCAYVARHCDGELRLTAIPDDKACSSYGVLSDGKVYALTRNEMVQSVTITTPEGADKSLTLQFGPSLPIPNDIPIVKMTCGIDHILMISKRGDLFSFGLNGRGQLGLGDIQPQNQPKLVKALAGIKVVSIACGYWHNVALSEFNDVYTWGWNEHKQLGHSPDVPVIAIPTLIELPSEVEDETNFVSIGCGERHSVAVCETGAVYTWGWNQYGQLGRSTEEIVDGKPQVIDAKISAVRTYCGCWNTLLVGEMLAT